MTAAHLKRAREHWDTIKANGLTASDLPELEQMIELLFMLATAQREGSKDESEPNRILPYDS